VIAAEDTIVFVTGAAVALAAVILSVSRKRESKVHVEPNQDEIRHE